MTDIFISYSRKDVEMVSTLARTLEEMGYSVWWDVSGLHGGQAFAQVIQEKLSEAKCCIAIWSESSVKSNWVHSEASFADNRGILLTAAYQDVQAPMPFNNRHNEDLRSWSGNVFDDGFQRLLKAVSRLCPLSSGKLRQTGANVGSVFDTINTNRKTLEAEQEQIALISTNKKLVSGLVLVLVVLMSAGGVLYHSANRPTPQVQTDDVNQLSATSSSPNISVVTEVSIDFLQQFSPVTLGIIGFILILCLTIGAVFVAFYTRAAKGKAFVRTGFGGEKAFINNGGFVVPVLHDKIDVNMKSLNIAISRDNEQSLRTRDRIRINISCEFFLRVEPIPESILIAAQTLGPKTLDPEELEEQVEGYLDNALRRAAVMMDMEELSDNRGEFGRNVEESLKADLEKVGMMLESVALTQVNPTDLEFYNVENTFDLQGRTSILQNIADEEKRQNEVKNVKKIAMAQGDLQAHNKQLEMEKQKAFADQEQANLRAYWQNRN